MNLAPLAEVAKMAGLSPSSISGRVRNGTLPAIKKKNRIYLDIEDAQVAILLEGKIDKDVKKRLKNAQKGIKDAKEKMELLPAWNAANARANGSGAVVPGSGSSAGNFSNDQIKDMLETGDIADLPKIFIEKFKIYEQVQQYKVQVEKERKELIPRDMVRRLFARIYAIDVNQLRPIGDKIAPELASIAGCNDNRKIIKMGRRIDDEIFKVLQHIKSEIDKFLDNVGAAALANKDMGKR